MYSRGTGDAAVSRIRIGFAIWRALLLVFMLLELSARLSLQWARGSQPEPAFVGAELRRLFERLGIAYVKLGQFLAMRFDALPMEMCLELGKLLEKVSPMEFGQIRQIVEGDLGGELEDFFQSFEEDCVASASVAQVHKARAMDGELLAVKVQRPGIEALFQTDIRNLRGLAWLGDRLLLGGGTSLVAAVDEFTEFTLREMNFLTEASTCERLRRNSESFGYVPRVRRDLTTVRVLSLEYVDGISMFTLCRLIEEGREEEISELLPNLDLNLTARNFVYASLRQLFLDGFFHADPHPGNILVRDDSTVVFVDFGIFGELTAAQRRHTAAYVENVSLFRLDRAFRNYLHMLVPTPEADLEAFKRDTLRIMNRWYRAAKDPTASVQERHMGSFINNTLRLYRKHHIRLDLDMLLFWRSLFLLDSTALRLSRYTDLLSVMAEFFADTRPPFWEQLKQSLTDSQGAIALDGPAWDLPHQLAGLVSERAREKPLTTDVEKLPGARRRTSKGVLAQVLALLGLTLAILAGSGDPGSASAVASNLAGSTVAGFGLASLLLFLLAMWRTES